MKNSSRLVLIGFLALLGIASVYFVFSDGKTSEPASPGTAVSEPAGPGSLYLTTLTDLQGNKVDMPEDKLIFLNIWATWCGPCNLEMPGIQSLYEKYKDNSKVAFYVVSDEDAETVNPFIARREYKLPFYQYTGAYPAQLDGNAIPRTYIIHKGKVIKEGIGASEWNSPEIHELIDKEIGS